MAHVVDRISGLVLVLVMASAAPIAIAQTDSAPSRARTEVERRVQELGSQLNCLCGCRAQISNCPHVQCGFGVPVENEVRRLVEEGRSDEEILDIMVETHGTKILSTPPAEGTNLGAYLAPVLFVLGGGIGAFFLLRRWQRGGRGPESPEEPKASASPDEVDERVEAHLSSLD